jgi:hypothetical protein
MFNFHICKYIEISDLQLIEDMIFIRLDQIPVIIPIGFGVDNSIETVYIRMIFYRKGSGAQRVSCSLNQPLPLPHGHTNPSVKSDESDAFVFCFGYCGGAGPQ